MLFVERRDHAFINDTLFNQMKLVSFASNGHLCVLRAASTARVHTQKTIVLMLDRSCLFVIDLCCVYDRSEICLQYKRLASLWNKLKIGTMSILLILDFLWARKFMEPKVWIICCSTLNPDKSPPF